MTTLTATQLRADLYRILDRILSTGRPVEVVLKGRKLRIAPTVPKSKFDRLVSHDDAIIGDPDELLSIDGSRLWKPWL